MNDTIRVGRIAGVRIGLNWSLLVMVAVVAVELAHGRFADEAAGYSGAAYTLAGMLTAVGLLLGVLLHELGHAVVARRAGLTVDGITLTWMGGVTRIQGEAPQAGSELLIAGVGPLVSAGFGVLLWGVRYGVERAGGGSLLLAGLGWLAAINLVLAVFNLLPATPLDGGRVLHASVWAVTRDRWRATRIAGLTGIGLGLALVVLGFVWMTKTVDPIDGFFLEVIGWWILASARAEMNLGSVRNALEGVRMADLMRPVAVAPGWITVRSFMDKYAAGHPGWVWLLEGWGGDSGAGYGGVLFGDAISAVPLPQWDLVRPQDVALPISATAGAGPNEGPLDVLARAGDKHLIFVVDEDRTIGAVLPSDVEALVKMGGRGPVPSQGWSLIRR